MGGFRAKLFRCGLGLLVVMGAIGAAPGVAAVWTGHFPGDVAHPDAGAFARYWVGCWSAVGVLLIAYLWFGFGRALTRTAESLREGIHALSQPQSEEPSVPVNMAEFQRCADELEYVGRTMRLRQERLSADAAIDPLTGLANRRTLLYTLDRETAVAQRTGWPLSVIIIDLDHFKDVNDTYGHQAGDLVLQRSARRLASLVRQSDVVARYGGEEFVVVLPSTAQDQAVEIAEQLRSALRCDHAIYDGMEIRITASFGVGEMHAGGAGNAEGLISLADAAVYEAKGQGRDRVVAAPTASNESNQEEGPAVSAASESAGAALLRSGAARGAKCVDGAECVDGADEPERPVDREAMALMGSTFSILQVIPDTHRVAKDVVQQVATVLQASHTALYVLDDQQVSLRAVASLAATEAEAYAPVSPTSELHAWFEEMQARDKLFPERCVEPQVLPGAGRNGAVALIRLPLVSQGAVIGVVEATAPMPAGELSSRQRAVLAALAAIGSTALRNCSTHHHSEARWLGLIESLCRTLHSFDAYKRKHAERVSAVACQLARQMGQQDSEALQLVRIAGLVHDIGKIGLPARLFKKRGRLRPSERKTLQQHCRLGAEILDKVANMGRLADIVRYHHEHFDGGGYPYGLAGSEIPIESRIIAVADAYDAMTSSRPFRAAFSHDETIRRVREASGTQFDPAVVEALCEAFPEAHLVNGLFEETPVAAEAVTPVIAVG